MTTFLHDSLDIIFDMVEKKEEVVRKKIQIQGSQYYRYEEDPFRLYQSYLTLVEPIEVTRDHSNFKEKIVNLQELLEEANERSNAVKVACQEYLDEEKAIKGKIASLENQLEQAKQIHR